MKRILFISHRVPYPPDKGERVRAFHEITALARHFRVTVATLAHEESDCEAARHLKKWCENVIIAPAGGVTGYLRGALKLLFAGSVTEGFFHSSRMSRILAEEADREPFDVVMAYSSGVLPLALAVPAGARVIDLVDVDSAKWESYSSRAPWPKSWLYRREARGVRALEARAVKECDAVFLVSEDEVKVLGKRSAKVIPVSNGVDSEYFASVGDSTTEPPSLVFTGTMDYRPNVEGVCWFVREAWPSLKDKIPELSFTIVGRSPTGAVRDLERVDGIHVTGSVPDVRPYLHDATVAVVPLNIARGIQNKVLEAMSSSRAVVASGPALEGLDVCPEHDVLQADTAEEWLEQITRLLSDDGLRRRVEESARRCVEEKYDWNARMQPLVDTCLRLAGEE